MHYRKNSEHYLINEDEITNKVLAGHMNGATVAIVLATVPLNNLIITGDRLENFGYKNKLDNMKKEYTWFMDSKNNIICNNLNKGTKCNHVRYMLAGQKELHKMMKPHKQQQRRYPQIVGIFELFIYIIELSELLTVHMFLFIFWAFGVLNLHGVA
ncbi:hypothetical protein ACJX0J_011643 [Zea mays]